MKQIRRLSLSLAFLAALAGCQNGGDAPRGADATDDVPEEQRYGGTAVVGITQDVPDINPLTSTDHNANQLQKYVLFMPLVMYNENFEPVPYLAKRWEVTPDTSALIMHLRDDVYWHDGVKTTAHDVKFSYDMARDPNTGFPNSAFWTHYGEAEVVDSFTIRIAMKPHAEYMDPWRAFSPAPKHILDGVPAAEMKTHPFNSKRPVGNGPFKFVSHVDGQSWTFEANEQFPKELGGRPYLDRIAVRVVPEQTTLLTELLTGRVDYYIAPPPEQAQRIKAAEGVRLVTFPDRAFVIIGWNQKRELFEDARVRRALSMAIDRQAIVDGVLYGYGQVGGTTVPPFFWQYDPQAASDIRYDPEEAKRLLAEAGWRDRDNNGVLENEKGKEFRFELKTNAGNQARKDITEVVQADLRKIGVVAQPRVLEWGTLLDQINDPKRRDFDALAIGWVTEFRIDDRDLFHCEKLNDPYQWVGYCDPETDRLLDTLPKIMDRNAAKPLWSQYQHKIAQDQPYTFVYFQERLEGVSNRLRNVDPDARGDWVGVKDWWILPNARRATQAAR